MRFKTKLKTTSNLIDLTPLVDVVFLMLIFFIITSDILPLKSLNIENPQIARDSSPLTTQLLLVMDRQNVIYVGSKKAIVDLASLEDHLKKEIEMLKKQSKNKSPTLVLSVDSQVDYESFLRLFSIAQQCCSTIRLVYKPADEMEAEYF